LKQDLLLEMEEKYEFIMQGSFFPHRALIRDTVMLHQLGMQIDSFSKEQISQIRKWYEFYWNMMESHHQAEDDILFFELEKKMDAPSETIEGMEIEHNRLQFLIDEIKRLIGEAERQADSSITVKSKLSEYTKELLELFAEHIEKEEKYIYEKMTSYFTPAEQQRIENLVKRKAPIRYLTYMIPWLHDSLSEKEKDVLDRSLPLSIKILNRFFWKKRYDRIAIPVKNLV
jgi:hemerythrin-like domain-containing protein